MTQSGVTDERSRCLRLPSVPHVEEFDFYGDTLIAVIIDGHEVVLPIRSVCAALGLDAQGQSQRLREHDVSLKGYGS